MNRKGSFLKWLIPIIWGIGLLYYFNLIPSVDSLSKLLQNPLHTAVEQSASTAVGGTTDAALSMNAQNVNALSIYNTLSADDQTIYTGIYQAIVNYEEYIYSESGLLNSYSEELTNHLFDIVAYVLYDHPEIFWTDGSGTITYRTPGRYICTFHYICEKEQVADISAQMDAVIDRALSGVTFSNNYEKVIWVYTWVIEHTSYDTLLAESGATTQADAYARTAAGTLLGGKTVCSGYAKTFQLMLHRLGIPCGFVSGVILETDTPHAWNIVMLDDKPFLVDPTWGDPSYSGSSESDWGVSYNYLGLTDADFAGKRTVDYADCYPTCTTTEYDYYRYTGRYFETLDDARMQSILDTTLESGTNVAAVKFANADLLQQASERYLTNQVLFDLISLPYTSITYSVDNVTNVLTLFFPN